MAISIKELAKNNNIKLELLLVGVAREEILATMSESVFGKYLWLCAPEKISLDHYKAGVDRSLKFGYSSDPKVTMEGMPGAPLTDRTKGAILLSLTGGRSIGSEKITGKVGPDGCIYIDVYVENMRVPLRIDIFPIRKDIGKPDKKHAYLLRGEREFSYLRYPSESELASNIFKVFKNLELIGDIGTYYSIYTDIMTKPIDGKMVWKELHGYISADHQQYDLRSLNQIIRYKDNASMIKKWDKYRKRYSIESLDWKKVITAFSVFINPIWQAICEDRPFIGDWMPELGRFL